MVSDVGGMFLPHLVRHFLFLTDGNLFELVANLISIEMMDDGLEEGISQTAIYSKLNRLNPIMNIV